MVKKDKVILKTKNGKEVEKTREEADRILNWCKVAKKVGLWVEVKKPDKSKNE